MAPFANAAHAKATLELGADIAAARKVAHTAIHAGIQRQSHRAFILGQASDPILAMATSPYGASINPLTFTNAPKAG